MSVKIIKEGTKTRIECNMCGALLEYTKEDIKEGEYYLSQRDSRRYEYILCPQCHNEVVLRSER